MKGRSVEQLVYETMFPKPKGTDPPSFHALLQRQLVQEVRNETASFYGSLESREAQYPGLDYSYSPHRMRLSRFTWHRRLFRAFDTLKLTPSEIAGLTKWEGTKWAKERFEKETGTVIRDTTGDGIHDWVEPELRGSSQGMQKPQECVIENMEGIELKGDTKAMDEDADESDVEIESVGIELNERLRAAAAQREAGDSTTVMDEEWEQWLKEAAEAGDIPFLAERDYSSSSTSDIEAGQSSATVMPPRLLNAARLGHWQEIPDFLRRMARQNIESSIHTVTTSPTRQSSQVQREIPTPLPARLISSRSSSASPMSFLHRHSTSPTSAGNRINLTRSVIPSASNISISHPYATLSWTPSTSSQQPQPRS